MLGEAELILLRRLELCEQRLFFLLSAAPLAVQTTSLVDGWLVVVLVILVLVLILVLVFVFVVILLVILLVIVVVVLIAPHILLLAADHVLAAIIRAAVHFLIVFLIVIVIHVILIVVVFLIFFLWPLAQSVLGFKFCARCDLSGVFSAGVPKIQSGAASNPPPASLHRHVLICEKLTPFIKPTIAAADLIFLGSRIRWPGIQ